MKVAALILGLAILATALWAASEFHYRSCVTAAVARTPVKVLSRPVPLNGGATGFAQEGAVTGARARQQAVSGCSRLPF